MRLYFTYDIFRITDISVIPKFILKSIREMLLEKEEIHDQTLEAVSAHRISLGEHSFGCEYSDSWKKLEK